ncbi:MAG: dihydropteroate synthase [Clostridiaceae bacterium]|nr:dihydropteroate synthase [Clostridiaceae bacterium]
MQIGRKEFLFNGSHTYVMGILNVTPDSFSDGGKYNNPDKALKHVEEMVAQGADIIDVGGESTRPGYTKISIEEEISRVTAVIEQIQKHFDVPISVDTYKAPVMDAALMAGADMANDIWGLRYDSLVAQTGQKSFRDGETMAEVVARHGKPVCIMQNRKEAVYNNLIDDMLADLQESVRIAGAAGISKEQIILDPGIGFGKTYEHNLEVLAKLDRFRSLKLPLLLAASRKSVIGLTLGLPAGQREEGTLATTFLAADAHWDMVRVHDVKKSVRAIRMLEKIWEYRDAD